MSEGAASRPSVRRTRLGLQCAVGIKWNQDAFADAQFVAGQVLGTVSGGSIEISFSRPLPSVAVLFDELFSSRDPYRLWGLHRSDEHYGECDVVDLHVGGCLRVEAQQQFLRVHVYDGTCGNTVARLVSNLQHRVDGSLRIVDPELDALLRVDRQLQTA